MLSLTLYDTEELAAICTAGGDKDSSSQLNSSSEFLTSNSVNVFGTSFFSFLLIGVTEKLQSK